MLQSFSLSKICFETRGWIFPLGAQRSALFLVTASLYGGELLKSSDVYSLAASLAGDEGAAGAEPGEEVPLPVQQGPRPGKRRPPKSILSYSFSQLFNFF